MDIEYYLTRKGDIHVFSDGETIDIKQNTIVDTSKLDDSDIYSVDKKQVVMVIVTILLAVLLSIAIITYILKRK